MKYPSRTCYAWIGLIQGTSFLQLLACLLIGYAVTDLLFAGIYCHARVLKSDAGGLDYVYFSFVTSLTIGYGDLAPTTALGKVVVIVHGCLTAIYFALMVAVMSAKMFYPKATIVFAEKLCFDLTRNILSLRLINTHREKLINPEVRVFVVEHCVGNVIASSHRVAKIDDKPYMGRHDLTLGFANTIEISPQGVIDVWAESEKARHHDQNAAGGHRSRFKLSVSIVGNYGMQQVAFVRDYYPFDIECGVAFKPIQYNEQDQRKGNIWYTDFPNFWTDFNTILPDERRHPEDLRCHGNRHE